MRCVRTIHWGTGAMGGRVLALAAANPGLEVAAVISQRGVETGRQAVERAVPGGIPGVVVAADLEAAVAGSGGADVLLLATHGRLAELEEQIVRACRQGLSVICIAEDTIFPWAVDRAAAARLDAAAVAGGVAVVGTGANPGFLMDYLPLVLLQANRGWRELRVHRKSSLDPYGASVLEAMGVGLSPADFEVAFERAGESFGHVAFEESIGFLGAHLGMRFEIVEKTTEPILGEQDGEPVVVGLDQRCVAVAASGQRIVLEHPQSRGLAERGEQPSDLIEIDGDPPLRLRAEPGVDGGAATVGLMVNLVGAVADASPGLHTMANFPVRALTRVRRAASVRPEHEEGAAA
jgi:hypothetical protein